MYIQYIYFYSNSKTINIYSCIIYYNSYSYYVAASAIRAVQEGWHG